MFMSKIPQQNKKSKVVSTSLTINTKESDDDKEAVIVLPRAINMSVKEPGLSMKSLLKARGAKGMKMFTTWIWYTPAASTSGAISAQAPVDQLIAGTSGEASSLVDLFDEFKVHKVRCFYNIVVSTTNNGFDAAVAYDPANGGVYASVAAVLPAEHHQLVAVSASFMQPIPHAKNGHWDFSAVLPKGAFTDSSGASITGDWADMTNFSTLDVGFLKWYIEAPSAGTTTLRRHIGLLCSFRVRS